MCLFNCNDGVTYACLTVKIDDKGSYDSLVTAVFTAANTLEQ